ncbi:MAG: dienelactone hydrolase family protein [Chitinophagaceae bacterium]
MNIRYSFMLSAVALASALVSCKSGTKKETTSAEPSIKEEIVSYDTDSIKLTNYVYYDENLKGPRPAILVIHEWWGLNDYARMRARKLAELGYIAMAVDMYGNGQTADNPARAQELSTPFYMNPQLAKTRVDMALENLKKNPHADGTRTAIIGYCFGGAVALGTARLGSDFKAAVSFHGNLNVVPANKDLLKAEVLVCHGAADPFVPPAEVEQFKKQMDSIGARYTFKAYEGAVHAFSNPAATALGEKFNIPIKYDAAADTASWNDMKTFFKQVLQ